MRKNSLLTLEYLINHAFRYAQSMSSDIETKMLTIAWNNGDTYNYGKEIWQDLPAFKRWIVNQKIWMQTTAH
jgi:hypothetical protein